MTVQTAVRNIVNTEDTEWLFKYVLPDENKYSFTLCVLQSCMVCLLITYTVIVNT